MSLLIIRCTKQMTLIALHFSKTVEVEVPVPFEFDLGNLTAFDPNGLDERRIKYETVPKFSILLSIDLPYILLFRNEKNKYLKDLARDGTQLLLNQIFALSTKSSTEGVFAELPEPTTVLPRAKPVRTRCHYLLLEPPSNPTFLFSVTQTKTTNKMGEVRQSKGHSEAEEGSHGAR